jgi:hypothetical protein
MLNVLPSAVRARRVVEPPTGPPPIPAEFVAVEMVRGGAYGELGHGRDVQAGSRWLVDPMTARQLVGRGDATSINQGDRTNA